MVALSPFFLRFLEALVEAAEIISLYYILRYSYVSMHISVHSMDPVTIQAVRHELNRPVSDLRTHCTHEVRKFTRRAQSQRVRAVVACFRFVNANVF